MANDSVWLPPIGSRWRTRGPDTHRLTILRNVGDVAWGLCSCGVNDVLWNDGWEPDNLYEDDPNGPG